MAPFSSSSVRLVAFAVAFLLVLPSTPAEARNLLQDPAALAQALAGTWAPAGGSTTGGTPGAGMAAFGTPGTPGTPGTSGRPGTPGTPGTPGGFGGGRPSWPIPPFTPSPPTDGTRPSTPIPQWPSQPNPAPTPQPAPPTTTPAPQPTPTPTPTPPTPTPTPTPSGGGSVGDPVLQGVLDQHNMYRARHHVPALTWSSSLQASAQSWANGCSFSHSNSGNGENIAWGYSTFKAGVEAWYAEVSQYNFANGGFSSATGHFTQIVWKSTTQLGCAVASCRQPFYVCQYSPPGNYGGQFQQNVFPA